MWSCCGSRDPKENKFLAANEKGEWQSVVKAVAEPGTDEVEVEVEYVALNSQDVTAIKNKALIGHSFSGTVKAVGKPSVELAKDAKAPFAKGDKIFGFVTKTETGAISDFLNVSVNNIAKVPSGVNQKTAAALPHIVHVYNGLNTQMTGGKKVHYSGSKGGYFESLFNATAKKTKSTIQTTETPVDFFFHVEGGKDTVETIKVIKQENLGNAWSLVPAVHDTFSKKVTAGSYPSDLKEAKAFTEVAENLEILKNVSFGGSEVITSADKLKTAMDSIAAGSMTPVVIDVSDTLKSVPKKEVPKPVEKTDATKTDATKTDAGTSK